jgi:hypothetical protein
MTEGTTGIPVGVTATSTGRESVQDPDYITVADACAIVGGTKPISYATYYRGVKAGRYPAPERVSAQSVRIRRAKLIEALENGAAGKVVRP